MPGTIMRMGKPVVRRQWRAVHFPGDERGHLVGFGKGKRLEKTVGRVEEHGGAIRLRLDHRQQRGQGHALPDGVGNQAAADAIGDALHRGFLFHGGQGGEFLEGPDARVFDVADDIETPDGACHVGIDEILGDLIELIVGRDLLDLCPAVLRAVVIKGAELIELAQHPAQRDGGQRAKPTRQEPATGQAGSGQCRGPVCG